MKMTHRIEKINRKSNLTVAFDISKDKLNYYYEIPGRLKSKDRELVECYEGEMENKAQVINQKLLDLARFAKDHGFEGLHVVCEPTGPYDRKLMRIARAKSYITAYVSVESVSKMKVVENNDTGKTDIKDPRVIHMLSKKIGKELTCRDLNLLRELNRMYDAEDSAHTSMKCQIHFLLQCLFFDYSFKKDFLYTLTGRVLVEHYHASPYRILKSGYKRFSVKMKKHAARVRKATLDRLWHDAQSSMLHQMDKDIIILLERRLLFLWEEYELHRKRRAQIKQEIVALYRRLLKKESLYQGPTINS